MIKKLKTKLNNDIHLKEIVTGSAVTFVLKMLGMLLGYVVILIISRQYGVEGVGVYNLTLSVMTFVVMVATMGINVSILRYVGQFNKSGEEYKLKLLYRYALEFVVPLSLILGALLYNFADVIAEKLFHNTVFTPALKFVAFIVPFMALQNISVEFIRGLRKLKVSEFLRSVNRPLVNISFLLIVGLFVGDQLLPLYTLGVGIVSSAVIAVYFIVTKIKHILPENKSEFKKKELLSTSLPMMVTTVISFLMGNISIFMLGFFSTTSAVGLFSVAFKIATLISLALLVVNTISAPKFSELYWNKKKNELQKVISQSAKLIFFSSLSIAIFILLFSNPILNFFGNGFEEASFPLFLLIIGQMINAAVGSVGIFLNMTGYQNYYRNIILISAVITTFLNYRLIPIYGITGAAISTIVGLAITNISAVILIKIKLGYITYYRPFKQG